MEYTVVDIEADGLLETVTKIHCLSYSIIRDGVQVEKGTLFKYKRIKKFLLNQKIIVGHNIIRYDIPVLEMLLEIKITARLIDTLALSWYLYPLRPKHGLELWGVDLGVPKPVITDWKNLTKAQYKHRCVEDVKINRLLFFKQLKYLKELYNDSSEEIDRVIRYLCFKLECAREQEEVGCKIDRIKVNKALEDLYVVQEEKVLALTEAMPRDIKYKQVSKPNKMYKKDESPTVAAEKWWELLDEHNLPEDYEGEVRVLVSDEPGNPGSPIQIKRWLFSLGWRPCTFEYRKNKAGVVKQIPQIYQEDGVADSIKVLYTTEPALQNLDMLSLINHRVGVFQAFLEKMNEEDYVKAEIHGFTNTLRFRHRKPIANLPKAFKFYGKEIRGAIIPPSEDYVLCGADMTSLEDTTKQHYMYFYDPEYVKQMRVPGFDPHLDIAVLAKMLTPEQAEQHKNKEVDYSQIRGKAKIVNFAGIYGAGPPKIALTTGMTLEEATVLHTIYWSRNKAVKKVEKSCKIKTVNGQMWLMNPVSGFWYSLRYLKDRFSTLNQGTGVYCFDLWVREIRRQGVKISLQYHDEVVISLLKQDREKVSNLLKKSIENINNSLKLNVPLGVDVQFGLNYAEIH